MAITAATTGKNRVYRSDNPFHIFPGAKGGLDATVNWQQGDLLYIDTSAHLIKVVAATGNAATFLGIANNTVVAGKLQNPYGTLTLTAAAEAIADIEGPVAGIVALMILKTGDTFNFGSHVYLADGQNSQTVTSVDPGDGNYIGTFQGTAVASAAAGQEGPCRIRSIFT